VVITLPGDLEAIFRQGGTVVLPSRGRAHAARLAHAAGQLRAGRGAWVTPDVIPIEAWLRREIEREALGNARLPRLLTPAQEWWLFRQCTEEATSEFELVGRGALAEALKGSLALAFDFRIDSSRFSALPGSELAVLAEVMRAVQQRAADLGAATVATLLEQLPAPAAARPLIFRGFLPPAPRLEALAAARSALGHDTAMRHVVGSGEPRSSLAKPRVVIAQDEGEELERIADWCRGQLEKDPEARLLVMLPGSPGRRERAATLMEQALDPGGWLELATAAESARPLAVIESSLPLAQAPAVAHALVSLAWLSGRPADLTTLGAWLRAPYFGQVGAASRALLDLWLHERGELYWGLRQVLSALAEAPAPLAAGARELGKCLEHAARMLESPSGSPREWAERMRQALRLLGWPGDRARDLIGQQAVTRFEELLDELGSLAAIVRQVSGEGALEWLTELAARTPLRSADEDPVVTITPELFDPTVRYDAVWVAGLAADAFPRPVQPDPFLPLPAQLAAGVPAASARGRLAEASALLARWRASTAALTLSAPARAQDLELLPSPLLSRWAREKPGLSAISTGSLAMRLRREGLIETLEDAIGVPWPAGHALPSGTRSLELQNQCPFRAYAELRLFCGQLRVPQLGVAPELRGQLLHAALQRLWLEMRSKETLEALSTQALAQLVNECVARSAQRLKPTHGPQPAGIERECRRAERLIERLCELEREREPFTVVGTELECTLTLGGRRLNVRIDRVDALAAGERAILDYKSGRRTAADWYGERPSHPQLLAYLAALGEQVIALATVNLTAREVRFEGLAHTSGVLPNVRAVAGRPGISARDAWSMRQREWLACVQHLATDFGAGQASVDPRPGACELCHLGSLCRIAEQDAVLAQGEEVAVESAGEEA
jgi:probable DNA repair protein